MMTVVAGLVWRGGQILACRRAPGQSHALKWEFPGGKLEAGETPAEALRRELREELAIDAEISDEVERYEYAYPGKKPILLIFFNVHRFEREPRNCVFAEIRWMNPELLTQLDFLEGDRDFVKRISLQTPR